jgi:2-methylcitrate dehydratase PrpD
LEFCVAVALIEGEASLKQFSDKKVKDSAVRELIQKIRYVHPPEMGSDLGDLRGELVVKLQNGQVFSRRVDEAKGDPRNPLTMEEIKKKYRDCVHSSLSSGDTEWSLDMISNLESINDIVELMDILTFKSNVPD